MGGTRWENLRCILAVQPIVQLHMTTSILFAIISMLISCTLKMNEKDWSSLRINALKIGKLLRFFLMLFLFLQEMV